MQNIDVRFSATTNFAAASAGLKALKADVASFNALVSKTGFAANAGQIDPGKYARATKAISAASQAYRLAAASSGQYVTSQVKVASATEKLTEKMRSGTASLRDMYGQRGKMFKAALAEQERLSRASAVNWGTDAAGRHVIDLSIPKASIASHKEFGSVLAQNKLRFDAMAKGAQKYGKDIQYAGRRAAMSFTLPTAIIAGAAGAAAYQADKELTRVAKVYDTAPGSNAAQKNAELMKLRADSFDLARSAADKYASSINDTFKVEAALAATGQRGNQLLKSTNEVMRISTLGELDYNQATEMTIALQTAFKQSAGELTKTFDFMNAVDNATSLSIADIADATPRAASGLAQLGVTAKEMTVMLVAMRESGVDAAEGANGLKSATTRIINPVKKATEYYGKFGISLADLATESGGNLFKYLGLLGKQQNKIQGPTEKQTKLMRAQGIAMLFGTYQNNRLTAALNNLTDAQAGVNNQTKRALDLMKASDASNAAVSANELQKRMESISGQFQHAVAIIKVELAEAGKPFVQVGTDILKVLTKVVKAFNGMPDGAKKVSIVLLGLVALLGPMVMLGGLAVEWTARFYVGLSKLFTKVTGGRHEIELLTKDLIAERASMSELTSITDVQTAAVISQAEAYDILRKSMAEARIAYQNVITPPVSGAMPMQSAVQQHAARGSTITPQMAQYMPKDVVAVRREDGTYAFYNPKANGTPIDPRAKTLPKNVFPVQNPDGTTTLYGGGRQVAAPLGINNSGVTHTPTSYGVKSSDVSTPAMRQNMPENMVAVRASDGTYRFYEPDKHGSPVPKGGKIPKNSFPVVDPKTGATVLMTGGKEVVPPKQLKDTGLLGLPPRAHPEVKTAEQLAETERQTAARAKSTADQAEKTSKSFGGARAGAAGMALSMGSMLSPSEKIAGYMNKAGMGLMAMGALQSLGGGAGLMAMLTNPITIGVAALAVGAGLLFKWHQHLQQIKQDNIDNQKAVNETVNSYSKMLNIRQRATKTLSLNSKSNGNASGAVGDAEKLSATKTGKDLVKTYSDSDQYRKDAIAAKQYNDVLGAVGGTAAKARRAVAALFVASGDDALEAQRKAILLGNTMKNLGRVGGSRTNEALINTTQNVAQAKVQGEYLGKEYADSIARGIEKNGMQGAVDAAQPFTRTFKDAFKDVWFSLNKTQKDELKRMGITTMAEMHKWMNTDLAKGNSGQGIFRAIGLDNTKQLEKVTVAEKGVVDEVKRQLGIKTKINSLTELQASWEYQLAIMGGKQNQQMENLAKQKAEQLVQTQEQMGFSHSAAEAAGLEIINQYRRNAGLQEAGSYAEALDTYMGNYAASAAAGVGVTNALAGSIGNAAQKMADLRAGIQNKLKNLSDVQSNQSDRLQNRQQAESSALDNSIQAHNDALDKHADAVSRYYDRLEKRMNAYYDRRVAAVGRAVKAEENADKIRQRIFDAEVTRLQRLAEKQNNTVDFNSALQTGNLDEAAKIMNNGAASAGKNEMADEQTKAEARSQARQDALQRQIDGLEKRRKKRSDEIAAARDSANRQIQIEKDKYSKFAQMQKDALQKRQDAEKKALAAAQKQRKADLENELEILKMGTFKNKSELVARLKTMGLKYKDFTRLIKDMGLDMSKFIKNSMVDQASKAGKVMGNNPNFRYAGKVMGERIAAGVADALNMTAKQFRKYAALGAGASAAQAGAGGYHTGGEIGKTKFGTGGQRRGMSGRMKSQEELVNAQKGEWMINKKAVRRYGADFFNDVNEGKLGTGSVGDYAGAFNRIMGVMARTEGSALAERVYTRTAANKRAYDAAQARKKAAKTSAGGAVIGGTGGRHRPVSRAFGLTQGVHDVSTGFPAVDFGVPVGNKVYAAADGKISKSYDIKGYEPRRQGPQDGYKSYGRVMVLDHGGFSTLYAHLSQRKGKVGQHVKGGANIAMSGNTGNSTGPHLHFGAAGISPTSFVGLRTGGRIKMDDTLINAHKDETVLTAPLTKHFENNIKNGGGGDEVSITIDMRGATISKDVDIQSAVEKGVHTMQGRVGRKRVVRD